ncbi:MAG: hypothetical protein FJW39_12575 [Acidobacteria bacterium]|nr:hypothetical protein [Acidobacteriota bacterium]
MPNYETLVSLEDQTGEVTRLRAQISDLLIRLVELEQYPSRYAELETRFRAMTAERDAEILRLQSMLSDSPQRVNPAPAGDDLQQIRGVGPVLENLLHDLGIFWFKQLARWTAEDIEFYRTKLGHFHGRIERDRWIEHARQLHREKYGEVLD